MIKRSAPRARVCAWRTWLPPRPDVVFALRTTAASFVALFLALGFGLAEPQWAMLTVFVVAQPFAGMTLAKGLYRVVGTLVGTAAAIGIVALTGQASLGQAPLGQAPLGFVAALALWIALCTFVAGLLRNPQAYGAALAGYTAPLVALPAFLHPGIVTQFGAARCVEIVLGILCAGLSSRMVLPQRLRPVLLSRLRTCLNDLAAYAADALDGAEITHERQRKLIEDSQALDALRAYALIEAPHLVAESRQVRRVLGELISAISAARTLHAHVRPGTAELDALLQRVAAALRCIATAEGAGDYGRISEAFAQVAVAIAARQEATRGGAEAQLHLATALANLSDLVEYVRRAMLDHAALLDASRAPDRTPLRRAPAPALHRDYVAALRNAVRAAVASGVLAVAWVLTPVPEGIFTVVIIAAITALFASLPDPLPPVRNFLRGTVYAVMPAFIGGQVLMPLLARHGHGVLWLVPVMAPALLLASLRMAQPRSNLVATAFSIFFVALLEPRGVPSAHPLFFVTGAAAALLGQAISILVFRTVLPPDPGSSVQRLLRALRGEIVRLCREPAPSSRLLFESRAYDQVNQILAHLPADPVVAARLLGGSSALVTIGLEARRLRDPTLLDHLPLTERRRVEGVLAGLADLLARTDGTGNVARLVAAARSLSLVIWAEAGSAHPRVAAALRLIAATLEDHRDFLTPAVRRDAGTPPPTVLSEGTLRKTL